MDIAILGIDLGKTVCSLAGLDDEGAVVFRKRIRRYRLLDFLTELPPCIVAMEACGGAHHTARFCLRHGHKPRLMSPLYVRPYVKVIPLGQGHYYPASGERHCFVCRVWTVRKRSQDVPCLC